MSSVVSLFFYISIFLLSAVFIYLSNTPRSGRFKLIFGQRNFIINPSLVLGVALPVVLAGFRQNVGTDFANYITEYNAAVQSGSYLGFIFNAISNFSNTFSGSSLLMFFIYSIATVVPVALAIWKSNAIKSEYRWLFWLLFLLIMFPQTFNLLRQGAAVSIGFYLMISIIESRKLFKLSHYLSLFLAISFHASALILIPLACISHIMNNKRRTSIFMFICGSSLLVLACFSILPQILHLLGLWSGYLDKTLISRSVIPRSLLLVLILLVYWKFYGVLRFVNSYASLLWIGFLTSLGGLFIAYFERIGYYVTLLVPLLVIVMIAQMAPRRQASLIKFCLCVFALIYFVSVYYLMGSSDIFPYKWSIE